MSTSDTNLTKHPGGSRHLAARCGACRAKRAPSTRADAHALSAQVTETNRSDGNAGSTSPQFFPIRFHDHF